MALVDAPPADVERFTWAEDVEDGDASRLGFQVSARLRVPALAVAHRPGRVILAAPSGLIPASRFRARAGPLFRRTPVTVGLYSDADGEALVDAAGEATDVLVDVFEADLSVLGSCALLEDDVFLRDSPGYWPSPAELLDYAAGALAALDGLPPEVDLVPPAGALDPPLPAAAPYVRPTAKAAAAAAAAPPAAGEVTLAAALPLGLDPAFLGQLLELQRLMVPGSAAPPGSAAAYVPAPPPAPAARAPPPPPPGLAAAASALPSSAAPPAGAAAAPPPPAPGSSQVVFPGLDRSVVAAARAAGIPESDLASFDRVVSAGSRRPPEPAPQRAAEIVEVVGEPPPPVDRFERLIDALSSVFADRPSSAGSAPADPVERALASLDAPRGTDPSSGRRGAAARLALRRALVDSPEHFSRYVEGQLASAFASRSAAGERPTMREHLEMRSRVGGHRPTVSWLWSVAGARDALAAGRTAEALARLDLAVVAGEQVSLDGGHWLLAQELLWEDDPPFHSFAGHRPAEPSRAAHSHLCDPRWAEAALARLKELDDWNERRRRLGGLPRVPPGAEAATPPGGGIADPAAVAQPKGPPRRPRGAPQQPPGATPP